MSLISSILFGSEISWNLLRSHRRFLCGQQAHSTIVDAIVVVAPVVVVVAFLNFCKI